MKTFTFILMLSLYINVNGQTNWSWVKSYGEVSYHEYTTAMCTDANGKSYITGTFQTSIIFGNDTLGPNGGMFIAKIDSAGNPVWASSPGGTGGLEILSMVIDNSGNLYLAGSLTGVAIFGTDTISNLTSPKNVFIGKFDSNGNLIWSQQATGVAENIAFGIALNNNSEVYVTGTYDSSVTIGSTFLQGGSGENIFIAKYDNNGNHLWAKSSSSTNVLFVTGIVCDQFNHVCITGHFSNTISFGSFTISSPINGGSSILLVKYDSAGNVLWAQNSGGFPSSGYAKCLSSDSSGNFYCAGYFNSPIMIFGTDTLTNAGFSDLFLTKYDSSGNYIWSERAGGADYDDANSIHTDINGNTYMTGFFKQYINFGTTVLTGPYQELYVAKYDANGNALWAATATGALNEAGTVLGLDNFNHVYVTGSFTSPTSTFGPYVITNTDPWTGSYDIFMARLEENPTTINNPEFTDGEALLIYPNPNNGQCQIINNLTNSVLQIYNSQGRKIIERDVNENGVVDLKNISTGIYFLQLTSKNKIRSCKLIIQ
jgi:hypothetical protein